MGYAYRSNILRFHEQVCSGFRMKGFGSGVQGAYIVYGLGVGFRAQGFQFEVWGEGLEPRVLSFLLV